MSGNLSFLVYPPHGDFYLVKLGLQNDLSREFEGFTAGHAAFPQGVPRPLALSCHRSFPTLVTTGIALTPLGEASMRAPQRSVRESLADFFARTSVAFRVEQGISHSQRIREACEELPAAIQGPMAHYLRAVGPQLDRLPDIMQHGDFYLNNLGMHGDALVVLDWEDYGRARIPGYDLALLLLSLNGFSPARLRENTRDQAAHEWILEVGAAGTGIDPALFVRLLPAYLAVTARIKTGMGYGKALRAQAIGAAEAQSCGALHGSGETRDQRATCTDAMAENQLTFALQFVVAVIVARRWRPG
jgi:aminoglycoside phosphotransferase (APT) family kinase protein